jgi:hypothetical protein
VPKIVDKPDRTGVVADRENDNGYKNSLAY